jgi:hypothetical protein
MREGTALRAPRRAKEPGLAMRGITALQARAVRFGGNALLVGTALRAPIPAKEPGRAMREGTAIQAPLQPWGVGLAMRGITALQARAVRVEVPGVSVVQARTPQRAQELPRRAILAGRDDTALQALPRRMAVLGVSVAQARFPRRLQEIPRRACPALRADTALQAPPRLKDPGLVIPEVSLPALPALPRALLVRLGLTACLGSLDRPVALLARYSSCKTSQSQIGKLIPTPRALALPSRSLPAVN